MPDFFSIQWAFQIDSWYFVGHLVDAEGSEYSLNFIFGRAATAGRNKTPLLAYLGVGLGSASSGAFYPCLGYGIDASDDPTHPAALIVPPAANDAFDLLFNSALTPSRARVSYVGGAPVGIAGARYRVDIAGMTSGAEGSSVVLGIDLHDQRGTLLEGSSGCVAPLSETDPGVFTYEIAQPRLAVIGGTVEIGGVEKALAGGNLWHDRQAYTYSPYAQPQAASASATPEALLKSVPGSGGNLYRGVWMGLGFDNGMSMLVSPQWAKVDAPGEQWISGRAVGRPPSGGYGNLFLPIDSPQHYNGGALLDAGTPDRPGDFDLNIFDPANPAHSPHWQGPSGNVYCTKWSLKFADGLAQCGVPGEVYVAALLDTCENQLIGSNPFWEGAVRIYADAACTQRIGTGFAEQMGCN